MFCSEDFVTMKESVRVADENRLKTDVTCQFRAVLFFVQQVKLLDFILKSLLLLNV